MWEQLADGTTVDGLRTTNPQGVTIHDLATDVSATEAFYAKLLYEVYDDNSNKQYIYGLHHYSENLYSDTPASLLGASLNERRVLYQKMNTGLDHLDIWLPFNRDNTAVPIYVVLRGTSNVYDSMVDLNLLHNHLTHSTFDYTQFNVVETQFRNKIYEMLAATTEPVIFISHSLGSEFALHIWHHIWTDPDGLYQSRLLINHFFNPFIIIDQIFEYSLAMSDEYKNTIHASIVEGDIFASVYKNHAIGPVKIYGNLVLENSNNWYSYTDFISAQLSWLQYLDLRNHRIISFLGEDTTNVIAEAEVHYTPEYGSKHITTRRSDYVIEFRENAQNVAISGQPLSLRLHKENTTHTWRLSNINVNSEGTEFSEFNMNIVYSGEAQYMIRYNQMWSLPLIISGDNNGERMYLFKSFTPNPISPLYYLGLVTSNTLYFIKPPSNIPSHNITPYLIRQENENTPAYQLRTLTDLEVAQSNGLAGLKHQNYEWTVGQVIQPSHTGYLGGTRRAVGILELELPDYNVILKSNLTTGQYTNQYLAGYLLGKGEHNTIEVNGHSLFTYDRDVWSTDVDNNVENDPLSSTIPDEYVWKLDYQGFNTITMSNTEQTDISISGVQMTFNTEFTANICGDVDIRNDVGHYLTNISDSNWGKVIWTTNKVHSWTMTIYSNNFIPDITE